MVINFKIIYYIQQSSPVISLSYSLNYPQYSFNYSLLGTAHLADEGSLDSKVHGAHIRPIWGWQDPGGPHVGPMKFAIWEGMGYTRGRSQ